MRFEWLFIGYLLMFSIPVGNITLLPALGYLLIMFAMLRLAKYEAAFEKAKKVLYAAIPIGFVLLAFQIYASVSPEAESLKPYVYSYNAVRFLNECAEMAVMFFTYLGVKSMGINAELPSLEKHASRNMSVMFVYFAFEMIMSALSIFTPSIFEGYEIVLAYPFIIGIIWRALNLWMIITCYLGIAPDTGDDTAKKEAEQQVRSSRNPPKKKKKKHKK